VARILYGTTYIEEDEPCLGLFEMMEQSPGSHGFHRYQIIYVMRGDRPAEYREDMGLAKKWRGVDQFRIPGGVYDEDTGKYYVEETVGRLREIAHKLRTKPLFDKKELVGLDKVKFH
jgi:hypothetical protein